MGVQHFPLGLNALWGAVCREGGGGPSRGDWPPTVVRGVGLQALSLPRPPVLWGRQPGFRVLCVSGAVGVGVGTQHRSHSVRSCEPWLRAVGMAAGRPRGGAFRRCEERLGSDALPPLAARPMGGLSGFATHVLWARVCGCGGPALSPWPACPVGGCVPRGWWGAVPGGAGLPPLQGASDVKRCLSPAARPFRRAAGVPRPVCPGCGRCGHGDPSVVPQRALLRAVVARCWGGGMASPGGMPFATVRGVWVQARSLPRLPVLWAGCQGLLPTCCGRGRVGCGGPALSPWLACPVGGCVPRGWSGAVSGGRGLQPLRGASGVRRCPSPGRPSIGAGGQGSVARVSRARLVSAWQSSTSPTACALASRCCALWGWRKGVPGGGAFRRCEGRLSSSGLPPPAAHPRGGLSGSATHVLWARVCGCGGPALSLWPACPVGGCVPRGWWGAVPGGVAFHCCEGRLVSGAVPPPAARPLWRAAGVPQPVCPGCGWCRRGDPAPAPQRAPLRAVVARCGGGGRASPGGGAFRRCEGRLSSGALPPPAARPLGGLSGSATHVL